MVINNKTRDPNQIQNMKSELKPNKCKCGQNQLYTPSLQLHETSTREDNPNKDILMYIPQTSCHHNPSVHNRVAQK